MGEVRYTYYNGGVDLSPEKRRASIEHSREAAAFRLNPSRGDVDSLIFLNRRPILENWLSSLPNDIDVLDVGGRIQPYRPLVESKLRSYVGVDLQCEGVVDVVGNAERLPIRSDSVDLVLCTDTLQYVPDAPAAVAEMHRVLKPGGQLILSTRGAYPEHHDELWRFLPSGLQHLARKFSTVQTVPEGYSGSGLMISINVLLHRNIHSPRLSRLTARTTTPLLNALGLFLDRIARGDSRSTCGISMRAIK